MTWEDEKCMAELQKEIEDDARNFILDSMDSDVPIEQMLDELASFYDGDPCDLF